MADKQRDVALIVVGMQELFRIMLGQKQRRRETGKEVNKILKLSYFTMYDLINPYLHDLLSRFR